ncbi:MAG TPA: alpha-glucan family phosphorylase [Candidatus Acidoferrales bacterium]|nr:alpha-glucan family phosphorylase [Candidatus Acidoferrales bacterium]
MPRVYPYHVSPSLPPRLEGLNKLSLNLRWSWNHPVIELFRTLDPDLWEETGHNPRLLLGCVDQRRLVELAADEAFLAQMDRASDDLDRYLAGAGWFAAAHPEAHDLRIAYFSAEFGLTECIPIYAGGLGILAGDHLKSASDLGLPLVGVGLLYQGGYFHQYLNRDGWQQETYPVNDFYNLPIQPVQDASGKPLTIQFNFPRRLAAAKVWKVQVGRVPLYLLDTNVPENSPNDRRITGALYGGDRELRMQQEIVLGVGGLRALMALGFRPAVCHMNEGHSAFLGPEWTRMFMEELQLPYHEARQVAAAGALFTTHTPVPAGFDRFEPALVAQYFSEYCRGLGLSIEQFLAYGRQDPADANEPLNMAFLASRHSSCTNGVAKLHGLVTRKMAQSMWPGYPLDEVPIGYVTNGIHTRSWISMEMSALLTRYLGPQWGERPADATLWQRIDRIPDQELWRVHEIRRERLVNYARKRLAAQLRLRGGSDTEIEVAGEVLSPDALTIGFARRFATYKRATLLLRDVERLKRILNHPTRPVQILLAGKAHPHDNEGKELIRQIIRFAADPQVRRSVVFLEDYDIAMARHLVQGCDVWLNTPRRPNEASGTSGMKLLANGGLNFSILDGWWDEAYNRQVGWAIGNGEEYTDPEYQDRVESAALYQILEHGVVPLYYDRDDAGLPRGWLAKMKASMKQLSTTYSTNRMVAEYAERFYIPAGARHLRLAGDKARIHSIMDWRKRLHIHGREVSVTKVEIDGAKTEFEIGARLRVRACVSLGGLDPGDVRVQAYFGPLDATGQIVQGSHVDLTRGECSGATCAYLGEVECSQSGSCGLTVRVVPYHEDALIPYELPWVQWAE